jgi:hypothetical protein
MGHDAAGEVSRGVKRGGTYVSVESLYLFRYLDEQVLRFYKRKENDQNCFLKAVGQVGREGSPTLN